MLRENNFVWCFLDQMRPIQMFELENNVQIIYGTLHILTYLAFAYFQFDNRDYSTEMIYNSSDSGGPQRHCK